MIVDVSTRIWNAIDDLGEAVASAARRRIEGPWDPLTAGFERHEEAIAPVSAAVVLGLHCEQLGAHIPDAAVAAQVQRDPARLIGFAGVDVAALDDAGGGPRAARQRVEDAKGLGLSGVTVSPAGAGFHPTSTAAMSLFEACADACVPVYVETGALLAREAQMEFSQPYLLDEVARQLPTLKLVIGGLGGPWLDQTLAMLGKHPSVFSDVTGFATRPWQLYNALLSAHQAGVMSQLLFGSGFPFSTPEQAIIALYSVNSQSQGTPLPGIPREALRGIVERDALACLGLPRLKPAEAEDPKSSSGFERVVLENSS